MNFDEAGREAARILADLIRLDTTNPPGNEYLVADYLANLFDREGIEYTRLARDKGRDNIIARLHGSGKGKPILLYSHSDVVPAEEGWGGWKVDPFAGVVRDGYLYGRGAIDAKGLLVSHLEAFLLLHRQKVPLDRDVIFLAAASEETGGGPGVAWLLREHPETIQAGVGLGEGGRVWVRGDTVWSAWVEAGEKSAHNLKVVAKGEAGHASVPSSRNAIDRLVRALYRLQGVKFDRDLNPVSKAFIETISPYDHYLRPGRERYEAITHTTFTVTLIHGGVKTNVIPAEAEANINLRLLPGDNLDDITKQLEKATGEPEVTIRHLPGVENNATMVPFDTPFFKDISNAVHSQWPRAVVAPYLSPGTTDASKLREAGVLAYGLMPFPLTAEDSEGVHGANERVKLTHLSEGVELMYDIVCDWAGTEGKATGAVGR